MKDKYVITLGKMEAKPPKYPNDSYTLMVSAARVIITDLGGRPTKSRVKTLLNLISTSLSSMGLASTVIPFTMKSGDKGFAFVKGATQEVEISKAQLIAALAITEGELEGV